MRRLARILRFCFGLHAINLVVGVVTIAVIVAGVKQGLMWRGSSAEDFAGGIVFCAAFAALLEAPPAIAWWMLRKGKPSARVWALLASLAILPVAVPGLDMFRSSNLWFILIPIPLTIARLLVTITGLAVFWRLEDVSEPLALESKPAREKGDGTSKIADIAAAVISIGGFFTLLYYWNDWSQSHKLVTSGPMRTLLELQAAVYIAVVGHELGHVAAGWVAGMSLRVFRVGPLKWSIQDGSWRFTFEAAHLMGGGLAGMVSRDFSDASGRALTTLGGPIGSFTIAVIAFVGAITSPGQAWEPVWSVFAFTATISALDLIVNMIPLRAESLYSDGAHFYQLMSKGPWARLDLACAMVASSLVTAVRPRDWDRELLLQAMKATARSERAILLRIYACMHHVDAGRIAAAVPCLEEAIHLYDGAVVKKPGDIYLEFAFYSAICKRDSTAADLWWTRWEALNLKDFNLEYWTTRTVVMWMRGQQEEAEESWRHGHAVALALPVAGAYEYDRWKCEHVRALIDSPAASCEPSMTPCA
jgi:hypothetical protein